MWSNVKQADFLGILRSITLRQNISCPRLGPRPVWRETRVGQRCIRRSCWARCRPSSGSDLWLLFQRCPSPASRIGGWNSRTCSSRSRPEKCQVSMPIQSIHCSLLLLVPSISLKTTVTLVMYQDRLMNNCSLPGLFGTFFHMTWTHSSWQNLWIFSKIPSVYPRILEVFLPAAKRQVMWWCRSKKLLMGFGPL